MVLEYRLPLKNHRNVPSEFTESDKSRGFSVIPTPIPFCPLASSCWLGSRPFRTENTLFFFNYDDYAVIYLRLIQAKNKTCWKTYLDKQFTEYYFIINSHFFPKTLVKAIREYRSSHHLLDILTEVIRRVVESGINEGQGKIQVPALSHTLRGKVFLK